MKTHAIIPIHSFVDVITNSSTELFIIDKEKGLEFVKEIVEKAFELFPGYGRMPNIRIDNPDYYEGNTYDVEEITDYLKKRGYKVEPPENPQEPEAIIISWEQGEMKRGFIKYISDTLDAQLMNS